MSLTAANVQLLRFHSVHEENVRLMNNRTVAFRHDGLGNGLTFSDRPIGINEAVFVHVLEVSRNLSGALRFGFTNHDPSTITELTPFRSPDYAAAMYGYWGMALPDRLVKKNFVFSYAVDCMGNVRYGFDSEIRGICFRGVKTSEKLWAVLDIYGSTRVVELINRFVYNDGLMQLPFLAKLKDDVVFHPVHGSNVILNSSRDIGRRKKESNAESYVFTDRCIGVELNLVIRVLSTNATGINFIYGFTSCNPSTLVGELLPVNPADLVNREEYWVVKDDTHCYSREDIIVYSIGSEGKVRVLKNNLYETATFYVDPTQPLWLFFYISGNISELKIMGTFVSDEAHDDLSELEQMRIVDDSLPKKEPSNDDILPKEEPSNEASGTSGEQEYTKCATCSEASVNHAIYKCGHLCFCNDCAVNVMKSESNVQCCPICDGPIADVFEIFP